VQKRDQQIVMEFRSHGGRREGAGRKPASPRPPVHHVRRAPLSARHPSHVTLRVRRELPSLRDRRFVSEFRPSLRAACDRGDFRVCHYSIQRDHVHMLVEADGKEALARGMKAVAARLARAANRVFRHKGPVLFGRYHLRALRTRREVRNALAYVLLNVRKHWRQRHGHPPPVRLDAASSGAWFDGWRRSAPAVERPGLQGVARPRTWLLVKGWRRYGLIDPAEVPGSMRRQRKA
jgi:REP element-mobilizing transposase RayT